MTTSELRRRTAARAAAIARLEAAHRTDATTGSNRANHLLLNAAITLRYPTLGLRRRTNRD